MKMSFMEVGTMLQETARTREEAIERFCVSCNKCYKAGTCNERMCPIARMHEARLLYFDAKVIAEHTPKHDNFLKVRQYNTSPEIQTRKRILKTLTKVAHEFQEKGVERDKILAVDNASVQAEDERYEDVFYILDKVHLKKLAKYVARVAGLAKED